MNNISSQDFRNSYEKFYNDMRRYLWPYNVLEQLANIEVDIYSAFIDLTKLGQDYTKLYSSIKDTCEEDKALADSYNAIANLINTPEPQLYSRLPKVSEVHPEKMKQLKVQV